MAPYPFAKEKELFDEEELRQLYEQRARIVVSLFDDSNVPFEFLIRAIADRVAREARGNTFDHLKIDDVINWLRLAATTLEGMR